ncbi:MAG: hypothetical protein Q9179_007153 [Wetmoreana sp. 5 TL-2023]
MAPNDHQHSEKPLRDHNTNRENVRNPPRKLVEVYEDDEKRPGMHKKTKSSVSLKSLIGNDKGRSSKSQTQGSEDEVKLKRPKSSTGLSALLSRSKSPEKSRPECKSPAKEKENRTPPQTADIAPPPIWAQFATPQKTNFTMTTRVPLNDRIDIEREAALYMPQEYSPSKQRNFHDCRPTLLRKTDSKHRPGSEVVGFGEVEGSSETISGLRKQLEPEKAPPYQDKKGSTEERAYDRRPLEAVASPDKACNGFDRPSSDAAATATTKFKRGPRVMAAVAAFNGAQKEVQETPTALSAPEILDVKAIENEFENLLETRNIPHNVRDRMRSLNTNIKIDFIRKEKSVSGSVSSTEGRTSASSRDGSRKRPNTGEQPNTEGGRCRIDEDLDDKTDAEGSPKKRRSRPRSRTFTFSKGDDSPKKKEKSEQPKSRGRSRSRNRAPDASGNADQSQASEARTRSLSFGRAPKPAIPEDFLSYLRKTQKPQDVEVGRLHKLRQLLRNETVAWVDAFIGQGGMTEVIGLLDRILKVEWRSVISSIASG